MLMICRMKVMYQTLRIINVITLNILNWKDAVMVLGGVSKELLVPAAAVFQVCFFARCLTLTGASD